MGTKLSTPEAKQLARYEADIAQGLSSFMSVGNALLKIRERNLYKATHRDFESYCRGRWNISRRYASYVIDAVEAADDVSEVIVNIGVDKTGTIVPKSEAVCREIAKIDGIPQRADFWTKVVDTAPRNKAGEPIITAAHAAKTRKADLGGPTVEPSDATAERDDFQVELDDASDVFRLLADVDATAVLRRLAVLRLEFEGE